MAQIEDKGSPPEFDYFKIKNCWWDALISYKGIPAKIRCLNFIIRRTYGWQKKEAPISLKEFSDATKITESNVAKILKGLKTEKLINVIKKKGSRQTIYSFNKYHKNWGCPETIKNDSFKQSETIKNDNLKLSKQIVSTIKNDSFNNVTPILVKNNIKTIKDSDQTVYDFYKNKVRPEQLSSYRAKDYIKRLLKKYSEKDLIQTISNYNKKANGRDPEYRKDPANFFSPKHKYYLDYLPGNFIKPKEDEWTNYSH